MQEGNVSMQSERKALTTHFSSLSTEHLCLQSFLHVQTESVSDASPNTPQKAFKESLVVNHLLTEISRIKKVKVTQLINAESVV